MSTPIEVYTLGVRKFFATAADIIRMHRGHWGPEAYLDPKEDPGRHQLVHATRLGLSTYEASIYCASIGGWGHRGYYAAALAPAWGEKIESTKMKELAREWDANSDQINAAFQRSYPKAQVKIVTFADLFWPKTPYCSEPEAVLRIVSTASAPMERKGQPVEFLRKQTTMLASFAERADLMERLGQLHYAPFGPDPIDMDDDAGSYQPWRP